jgi:acetyl/propionyl-CoA carboxylase alpha subunit
MAAMSPIRRQLVVPTPASAHPGDGPVTIDPADPSDATASRWGTTVGRLGPPDTEGRRVAEIVVDGWRYEFTVEDADRAALRERASRDRCGAGRVGGRLEIRAIIPGRIAAVAVTPGDEVAAGQTLLAVEAMKMQNELRAPRAGVVGRVAAAVGTTVEVGALLLVLE